MHSCSLSCFSAFSWFYSLRLCFCKAFHPGCVPTLPICGIMKKSYRMPGERPPSVIIFMRFSVAGKARAKCSTFAFTKTGSLGKYTLASTSCKYISMVLWAIHLPLLRTSSASSVTIRRWVAPPARKEPKSSMRSLLTEAPMASSNCLKRFLSSCPECGQSLSFGFSFSKAHDTKVTRSSWSILAIWWRAALKRVLGSWTFKSTDKCEKPTSMGKTKSCRRAWSTSFGIQIPRTRLLPQRQAAIPKWWLSSKRPKELGRGMPCGALLVPHEKLDPMPLSSSYEWWAYLP